MPLPDKHYFSLQSLSDRWEIPFDDIRYYAEHEELELCCWLDMREVIFYRSMGKECKFAGECRKFEGYVGIHSRDCRKVFRCGKYKLTNFIHLERNNCMITIAPQSRDVVISTDDLRITRPECQRFEKDNDLEPSCECDVPVSHNGTDGLVIRTGTREFHYKGEPMRLGLIQADIIKQLAEARQDGMCWVYGKTLLHRAGSQAIRMRDIFKSNSRWHEIMESDRRGHYRIREHIPVNLD